MDLRAYDETPDRAWLEDQISGGYGAGHLQARRGELIDVLLGNGVVAEQAGRPVGVVLWRADDDGSTELTYLWAFEPGSGVGTQLVRAMFERVSPPVWVVTTNDDLDALRFYQRLGFRLRALRPGAVDAARRDLKPSIPLEAGGIPIRDEIELVLEAPDRRGERGDA